MLTSLSKFFPHRTSQLGFSLVALVALSAPGLFAQGYGSVSGTVTDPSGAAIPNASVTAIQVGTGHQTIVNSSDAGTFVFTTLPPATYDFKVTASGFELY